MTSSTPGAVSLGSSTRFASALQELSIGALLLGMENLPGDQYVHVYVPTRPTVAFTAHDSRSPGFAEALQVARRAGFDTAVRSPGGRFVAYDDGAVVVDHVDRSTGLQAAGARTFSENANAHAAFLGRLGVPEIRVGEVPNEYCPGEFSVNVSGRTKVIGSAQRVTNRGSLFSTVVQVELSADVRDVIVHVSDALGYEIEPDSIGGLADFASELDARRVSGSLASDYCERLRLPMQRLPRSIVDRVAALAPDAVAAGPFNVADWARAQTRL